MKLGAKTLGYIELITEISKRLNLDVFIMDKNGIKAKSQELYIFIVMEKEMPWLEVDSICVNKIQELNSRLSFIKKLAEDEGESYSLRIPEHKELDSGDKIAKKIRIDGPRTGVEVSCANGSLYKLPSGIKDKNIVSFVMEDSTAKVISGLGRVVRNKNNTINIKGIKGNIFLEIADNEGDSALHLITKTPEFYTEDYNFSYTYKHNKIVPLIQNGQLTKFTITERGCLLVDIKGLTAIVFPETDGR
jgi:hypothetical protein